MTGCLPECRTVAGGVLSNMTNRQKVEQSKSEFYIDAWGGFLLTEGVQLAFLDLLSKENQEYDGKYDTIINDGIKNKNKFFNFVSSTNPIEFANMYISEK